MHAPLYEQVLPRKLLRVLAVTCLALSIAFGILGIFSPQRFENDIARFMVCLLISTLLAVFFFIFYPEKLQMNLPLMIGSTLRLAGPIVLWVGVLLLLLQYAPSSEAGRLFEVIRDGKPGGMYLGDHSTTFFTAEDGTEPKQWLVGAQDNPRTLYGIYVVFPRNVQRLDGKLHHDGWLVPIEVTLTREGTEVIDVSTAKERTTR